MVDSRSKEFKNSFQMNVLQQQNQQVFDEIFTKSRSQPVKIHNLVNDAKSSSTKLSPSSEMPVTTTSSLKYPLSSPNGLKNSATLEQIQLQYHQIMSQMQLGLTSSPPPTRDGQGTAHHVSCVYL